MKMKGFLNEFKEFALKGNVIDLAVGIIIGAAFTAIITSLVNDIISPLLGLSVSVNFSSLQAETGGAVFTYGNFIMAVINFLLVALVLFMIIRSINRMSNLKRKEEKEEVTRKACPYCKNDIPLEAVRCPYCTSELTSEEQIR